MQFAKIKQTTAEFCTAYIFPHQSKRTTLPKNLNNNILRHKINTLLMLLHWGIWDLLDTFTCSFLSSRGRKWGVNEKRLLSAVLWCALLYKHRNLILEQIFKRQTEMTFFHLTQILLSADTRINFILIKPNGNCYAARATYILRTLVSKWIKPHVKVLISIINKLVVQTFNEQTNMQTCDTRHYLRKNIMPLWSQGWR